jgi:hypothetical protein
MRRAAAVPFALVLAASAFAQAPSQAASNEPTAQFASAKDPSVQKACGLLNDMIRTLGGAAWLSVRAITSEGRSYAFYHGRPSGTGTLFWRFWQYPDKERVELTKERDIIEIYNGDKAYETTYKGTVTQDQKDLDEYMRRRNHSLEWVVREWLPAKDTTILYSGTAMVERNLADQVTVLNGNNDSVIISIDQTSHLPVRVSYSFRDPVDRQFDEESVIFSNYKLIQGVQTPYIVVRNRNGEMSSQRFITSATYNGDLSPALFEPKGMLYNQKKDQPKQ